MKPARVVVTEVHYNGPTNKVYSVSVYFRGENIARFKSKNAVEEYFHLKLLDFTFDRVVKTLEEETHHLISSNLMDVS